LKSRDVTIPPSVNRVLAAKRLGLHARANSEDNVKLLSQVANNHWSGLSVVAYLSKGGMRQVRKPAGLQHYPDLSCFINKFSWRVKSAGVDG